MITSLHFENFKSLSNVTIDFNRFTVLVGGNGCGKSSVLEGAELLSRVNQWIPSETTAGGRLWTMFSGPRELRRIATTGAKSAIVMGLTGGGETFEIHGDFLTGSRVFAGMPPEPWFRILWKDEAASIEASLPMPQPAPSRPPFWDILQKTVVQSLTSTVRLHLNAAQMVLPSVSESVTPTLQPDGSGLASTLAYLKGAKEEIVEAIAADLALVVPGARRIRTFPEVINDYVSEPLEVEGQTVYRGVHRSRAGHRFEVEFDKGGSIPADLLSEGTVLALGLITKLHEPAPPRLLLLDDIDRALHPSAQAKLVKALRTLLDAHEDLQIVCTTHSPDLISSFRPEEVRVMALDAERHSRVKPLTSHPEFDKVKHGFQTGEIWSYLGEEWVVADDAHG